MQEFPNLLRQRLGARAVSQVHPDPDTLTAFVEHALSPAEHRNVISHLADCASCREVIALSSPVLEEEPVAWKTQTSVRPGFWAVGFRWAAAVATIAVAVTMVVERPWEHRGVQTASYRTASPAPAPNVAPNQPVTPGSPASQQTTSSASAIETQLVPAAPQKTYLEARKVEVEHQQDSKTTAAMAHREAPPEVAPAQRGVIAGSLSRTPVSGFASATGGPANHTAVMDNLASNNAAAAPANNIVITSAPVPRNAAAGSGADVAGFKRATPPPLSADRIGSTALAMRSEKAENATVPPPPAPAASSNRVMDSLKFVGSLPSRVKSSVASAAKVERGGSAGAFSAGNVRFDASLARERESIGRGTGPSYWEISPDGKLIKSSDKTEWHEAYPQEQDLRFKALATSGHEIWAGGSQLTLIHSWNGGVNWQKLKLEDAGSGDITAISIDGGNVQVKTSNGQTFVTQDGGVTWVPLKPNEQK
jgi:photosynthesis system II assembly factor YCF48-like protein/putative zinc finger protein